MTKDLLKEQLHVRNRFRAGYDFHRLAAINPALAAFVALNAHGVESIDYANPEAVKALNQALMAAAYGLRHWDLPPGYLCPAIPGRSDYLHYLADLLGEGEGEIPRGRSVRVLDIGMGASCIYPLIGASEYGWRMVGSEIDPVALRWAKTLVAANRSMNGLIECRMQTSPLQCFDGVVQHRELFDLSMCNPPFHASAEEAAASNARKRRNLGGRKQTPAVRNFGGQSGELWCAGGELGFVRRMIAQSAKVSRQFRWFTTLVSKSEHLAPLRQTLKDVNADMRIIDTAQGQKQSRILAWTFSRLSEENQTDRSRSSFRKRIVKTG